MSLAIPEDAQSNPQPLSNDAALPSAPLLQSDDGTRGENRETSGVRPEHNSSGTSNNANQQKDENDVGGKEKNPTAKTAADRNPGSRKPETTAKAGGDPVEIPSYSHMIRALGSFLATHKNVSSFRLKIKEIKPGQAVVYQGQLSDRWVTLMAGEGTYFVRTSLLRAILNLKDSDNQVDKVLYRYFSEYSLGTGRKAIR